MQTYHKLSIIMKYIRVILLLIIVVYCLYLSTNTIFCLFDKLSCCGDEISLTSLIDLRKFVFDTYVITFVMMLFVVLYLGKKNKLNLKNIIINIFRLLLFLPISALLNYNFMILGSLMSSFYLVIFVAVIIFSIDYLTKKIDRLYEIAVSGKEVMVVVDKNGKGDNKKCKKK